MKNNESIFGYFVFIYKIILVLAVFKLFGWCNVIPDNLITTSFIVVTIAELVALVHNSLIKGISALMDEHEANKRWHQFNKPIEDSEVRLYWNPETKEIIQIENKK